ncbi:hypothetical protein GCM10028857_04340 [Salinarchaeum chitinilyticum]
MHRRRALAGIGASAAIGTAGCLGVLSDDSQPDGHPPEEVLSVAHLDGRYHFTDEPFLLEGADVIADLGTNVCKIWLDFPAWYYQYNSDWQEEYDSMVALAEHPDYRALFERPFSTYLLKATANHAWPMNYYRDGIHDWQLEGERERFEAITRHFLETYDGTGKTFVLQDVESDFWAVPEDDWTNELPDSTVDAMRQWYAARQTGVERGRSGVESDATVLHLAEVSMVLDAKRFGASRVINEVLPDVELDMVSYSAYELGAQISGNAYLPGHNDRQQFDESDRIVRETLAYIDEHASTTGYAEEILSEKQRPVMLGEFGVPLQETGEERGMRTLRAVLEPSLEWGVRWANYWQVYDNELAEGEPPADGGTVSENDAVRGFYLVRPDGTKAPTWDYFEEILARDVRY